MNKHVSFLLCLAIFVPASYSKTYQCDIFNEGKKVTSLTGTLPDTVSKQSPNANDHPEEALAYYLCQRAGFPLINTKIPVVGLRNASKVSKNQSYPDPRCTLRCTPITHNP